MNVTEMKRPRGRPSVFDHEEALDKALLVFWTRGYEGASMAELTHALAINRPSIYAAFGNKEALFRKVMEKYLSGPVSYVSEAFKQPTAKQAVEMLLVKSAEFLGNPDHPKGCMLVQGALTCGQGAELIQQELAGFRKGYENALTKRLEFAQSQHDFPKEINPAEFAKYIATVHQGMSVQATSGATKEDLLAVVSLVLKNWPR